MVVDRGQRREGRRGGAGASLRPGGRPATYGRVESRVPARRVGGRGQRTGGGGHVRGPQQGRAPGPHEVVAAGSGPGGGTRTRVHLHHRGGGARGHRLAVPLRGGRRGDQG